VRIRGLAAALAIVTLYPTKPIADVRMAIIEYRVIQAVGQVRLTTGYVHDPATQKAMLADLAWFDRQGIILIGGDSIRRFNRRQSIGAHVVETTISVRPAIGHGYRGGLATADVIVTVDGRKAIDCPYDGGPTELDDVGILPRDGMISILGSYDGKHVQRVVSLTGNQTIDPTWLARNAR
jgi:hypothetical protein